jgi:hypothetical protein
MTNEVHSKYNTKTCNLQPREAHLASICVAIVFGVLGGKLSLWFYEEPTWHLYAATAGYGFMFPWLVCKHLFPTAHHWYGAKSWAHRAYDLIGVAAAFGAWWL